MYFLIYRKGYSQIALAVKFKVIGYVYIKQGRAGGMPNPLQRFSEI